MLPKQYRMTECPRSVPARGSPRAVTRGAEASSASPTSVNEVGKQVALMPMLFSQSLHGLQNGIE